MSTASHRSHWSRRAGALGAAVTCTVLLAACGGDGDSSDAAATSAPTSDEASPSASESLRPGGELAAGLLPTESFGPDATVVDVPEEQLREGAGLTAADEDVKIEPESCAAAVEGTQPQIDDDAEVAAVSATTAGTTTVEVLLRGDAIDGSVEQLTNAVTNCPEARITSPEIGTATLVFEAVDVPDLGDGSAALQYTTTVTQNGTELSIPALVGVVQDGDRVLTLLTLSADGSEPDVAAFTALLEEAYQVQADALG